MKVVNKGDNVGAVHDGKGRGAGDEVGVAHDGEKGVVQVMRWEWHMMGKRVWCR